MKKIILNKKNKLAGIVLLLVLIQNQSNRAQSGLTNFGILYVQDGTQLSLSKGEFSLGTQPPSSDGAQTTRTSGVYGKISLGTEATFSGANDSHFVDGYVKTLGMSEFIFPIGQSGVYAPIKVIPYFGTGVEAAYFRSSPAIIGTTLDSTVGSISAVEYWKISGASSKISLSWRESSLISSLNNIIIAGYDGTKWVLIPSTYDTTSVFGGITTTTSGSITSKSEVNFSTYTAFAIGDNAVLNTLDNNYNNVFLTIDKEIFHISSKEIGISTIEIFDITGKNIQTYNAENKFTLSKPFIYANGIYIAKVKLTNGSVVTKKINN